MKNSYFRFKQFTVYQDCCAMKVGTDGTLLGAWASVGSQASPVLILDIGTGTGLIALMMAQRFHNAQVVGVDIDEGAVGQARDNVAGSPFADRITVRRCDIRSINGNHNEIENDKHNEKDFVGRRFDAIVCNPPYFVNALVSPDHQRTLARHSSTLSYRELMVCSSRLLAEEGELSVVIPFDCKSRLESEAVLTGLSKVRECGVRTKAGGAVRRYLLAFRKHPAPIEKTELLIGSEEYHELTKDFYL